MAKKKKAKLKPKDPAAALAAMEQPNVKWKVIAQIAVDVLLIWDRRDAGDDEAFVGDVGVSSASQRTRRATAGSVVRA